MGAFVDRGWNPQIILQIVVVQLHLDYKSFPSFSLQGEEWNNEAQRTKWVEHFVNIILKLGTWSYNLKRLMTSDLWWLSFFLLSQTNEQAHSN